jgi:nucleotide-binding universal stress UspA family protein
MSTHGRSGPERWYLGSVADKVLQSAVVPLLLYRPKEDEVSEVTFQKIIVPLDESTLAKEALPTAEFLARTLDLELLLVRVLNTYSWAFTDLSPYGAHNLPVELLQTIEEAATKYLDNTVAGLREKGLKADSRLMLGDPGSEINDLASQTPNSLVVISTHGRSGVGRMVMGSVADKVVRGSGSPVLLLR